MIHVLIISHDRVGRHMAGPGIRYSELARALAQHFRVTLAVPDGTDLDDPPFATWPYQRGQWDTLSSIVDESDVVVAPGDALADFPVLAQMNMPLVIDGYDPHTLETLALWAGESEDLQLARYRARLDVLHQQCQAGDFFLCASERQRDWWLGALEAQGRLGPRAYAVDPSLRHLGDIVPYGLPSASPQASKPVLRGVWPGVGPEDKIILWGGGLWQWLDPLTALRAVRHLVDNGAKQIRIVFPGTRHPNPDMPDMPLRARVLALADELELTNRHAFFGDWVPYEDWPMVLLEADVGLSLHHNTVETRLAYRSRALDYIWAGLPMAVTRGDVISEIVQSQELGIVVDYGDDAGVADAISTLLAQPKAAWRDRFAHAQAEMTWEQAARPLIDFCRAPYRTVDRHPKSTQDGKDPKPELAQPLAERDAEIARLQELVTGYEQGRFMQLMRQIHGWRKKVGL